ncbi:GNAT family acetyltransferase [Paracoccaceae bacterium]|nr:GNAT family acetyltransferase [Paracoccaceae bacterium]|tara:strand:+ start:146 stop:571 length:426 start_codon:yes stop_codon:yes gene_type:complete
MKTIRIYQEEDRKEVLTLWQECNLIRSKNDPQKDLGRKKGFGEELFLVLVNEDKIIGTVMGGYDGHRGIINYLGVHPNFRGNGLGRMLMRAVEKKLRDLGCPQVNLLVWSDNTEVHKFYEKTDYKKANDIVLFRKRLIGDE